MLKPNAMTELSHEMLAATLSGHAIGLTLLLAEMRALSEVMPGALAQGSALPKPVAAAEEADFDNMPV